MHPQLLTLYPNHTEIQCVGSTLMGKAFKTDGTPVLEVLETHCEDCGEDLKPFRPHAD